jgi:hypothetical protein
MVLDALLNPLSIIGFITVTIGFVLADTFSGQLYVHGGTLLGAIGFFLLGFVVGGESGAFAIAGGAIAAVVGTAAYIYWVGTDSYKSQSLEMSS